MRIQGIEGRPELNGQNGIADSYRPETQRCVVTLASGEVVALRAANLVDREGDRVGGRGVGGGGGGGGGGGLFDMAMHAAGRGAHQFQQLTGIMVTPNQMGAAMAVSFKKEGALSSNNIYLYVLYGAVRRRIPWSRLPHRQTFALPSMTLDSPHSASLLGCFFIMVIVVFTLDCHVKKGLRCTSSFLFHCHMLGNCWNVGLLLFLPRWVAVLQRLPWRVRRRWVWRWNWRILERNSRYLVAYICWVFVLNRVPNGRRWNAARLEL